MYIKRPDLPAGYDGWQALDATPQERSDGMGYNSLNIILLTLYLTIPSFNNNPLSPKKKAFQNIVGKRGNASNQHFLLSPQCFSTLPNKYFNFGSDLPWSFSNPFDLDWSKSYTGYYQWTDP